MTKHRLELFSDGVFAIVLTLLVLDLKAPTAHGLAALKEIAPALVVHAGVFAMVGVLWMVHHGGLARVVEISSRTLMMNLLALFWVTLFPFAAKTAAEQPLEPLGASLMAILCGAYLLSMLATRLSAHSTIDDNPDMRVWRHRRFLMGMTVALIDLGGGVLAWINPWPGYAAALGTMILFLVLRSPPEAERRFATESA
ncbi:MAG TPA: TMEM175 family protein [Caulobacteraceae bacterium]|jgi:uncharacterized membrane protein